MSTDKPNNSLDDKRLTSPELDRPHLNSPELSRAHLESPQLSREHLESAEKDQVSLDGSQLDTPRLDAPAGKPIAMSENLEKTAPQKPIVMPQGSPEGKKG